MNLDFNFIDVRESLLCSIEAINYNSATFFGISSKIKFVKIIYYWIVALN